MTNIAADAASVGRPPFTRWKFTQVAQPQWESLLADTGGKVVGKFQAAIAGGGKAYLLENQRLAELCSNLRVGSQPVVDETSVEVLPVVRPQVDGGKVNVLVHLHASRGGLS